MTGRRGILAGLFGAVFARGQDSGATSPGRIDPPEWRLTPKVSISYPKPANNQCPVCGVMADPILQTTDFLATCHSSADGLLAECDPPKYREFANVVRCSFCNAAFFQDAVKP